jgi:thiol-disulfide isomerase/thioredoxin
LILTYCLFGVGIFYYPSRTFYTIVYVYIYKHVHTRIHIHIQIHVHIHIHIHMYIYMNTTTQRCPPCRQFTPLLSSVYNEIQAAGQAFEIVFISSDRSPGTASAYHSEMPWKALPYALREKKQALSTHFEIQGIPTLVLLDENGHTITTKVNISIRYSPSTQKIYIVSYTIYT